MEGSSGLGDTGGIYVQYIYVQFNRMSIKAVHQQIFFHCELIIMENTEQLTILSLYR